MKQIIKLNAFDVSGDRGWFIGHFADIPEINTNDLEAQIVKLPTGKHKDGFSFQKKAKTLTMVLSGKMEIYFPDEETIKLEKEGDFVIFSNKVEHTWTCIEKATILTIRWPSIPDDVQRSK